MFIRDLVKMKCAPIYTHYFYTDTKKASSVINFIIVYTSLGKTTLFSYMYIQNIYDTDTIYTLSLVSRRTYQLNGGPSCPQVIRNDSLAHLSPFVLADLPPSRSSVYRSPDNIDGSCCVDIPERV